jgi:hypothetical protein
MMPNWALSCSRTDDGTWIWELFAAGRQGERSTHVTASGPIKLLRLFVKARRRW